MRINLFISTLIFLFPVCLVAQDATISGVDGEAAEVEIKTLEWPDGTRYEGGVLNGKKEGQGVIYWADGTRFEGTFSNDLRDGPGSMIFPDGTVFTATFSNNQVVAEEIPEPEADLLQAEREEAERLAAEAAREQAEREEAERQAALELAAQEQAAREQAEREEAERLAAEAAREQAEREEAERQAALELAAQEQAAREQAEREEAERLAAELAVREQLSADDYPELRYTDELEDEIVAVVDAWARAWSAQNAALYLSFYSDDFMVPEGMSRSTWERERQTRINTPEFIQVDIGYAQFELLGDNSIYVYLRQGYTSDSYSDFTNKKIQLAKENDLWKIVSEEQI